MNARCSKPAVLALFVSAAACSASPHDEQPAARASQALGANAVVLTACVESIGVGLAPTANARAYVPARFTLAGDGGPVTPIVVRTSRCDGISVDGAAPRAGSVVQIGAVLVPPDFTGDIDNYTFFYVTTYDALAEHLRDLGLDATHVDSLDYDYAAAAGTLSVRVPGEGHLPLVLRGTVTPHTTPSAFVANWWRAVDGGALKLTTSVPIIDNGDASLTLTTDDDSALARLFGATTVAFPLVQQFNVFPSATIAATVPPQRAYVLASLARVKRRTRSRSASCGTRASFAERSPCSATHRSTR